MYMVQNFHFKNNLIFILEGLNYCQFKDMQIYFLYDRWQRATLHGASKHKSKIDEGPSANFLFHMLLTVSTG